MMVATLADFFMDIKDWIIGWDMITFSIVMIVLVGLAFSCLVTFLKKILGDKPKFKFFPFLFLLILIALIVILVVIRK